MDISKTFKTDHTKEEQGTWVPIGDGAELLVARFGNKNHSKAIELAYAPYRNHRQIPTDVAEKLACETMAKQILLGWKNIQHEGKPFEYSYANALFLLKEYKDFRDLVAKLSGEMDIFRAEQLEQDSKNSKSTSSGS